jgi:hypothetical protein
MSVRYCGKCGAGWGADFNFCAKDGTNLNVEAIAQLPAAAPAAVVVSVAPAAVKAAPKAAPVVAEAAPAPASGQRKLSRKPRGTWAFGLGHQAEQRAAQASSDGPGFERKLVAESVPAPQKSSRSPWGAKPEPVKAAVEPAKAPAKPPVEPVRVKAEGFDLPELDFARKPRLERAPAEAPRARAAAEPVAQVSPPPDVRPFPDPRRIEGPETRGRRRPQKSNAAAPEVERAVKELAVEPARLDSTEAVRGEANPESVFTAKKRRDAAAFSDTAWFRRPLENAQIDPVSGRVAHTESTYRPDPKVTPTQRRKFSLRRAEETV